MSIKREKCQAPKRRGSRMPPHTASPRTAQTRGRNWNIPASLFKIWGQTNPQEVGKAELGEFGQAPDKSDFLFLVAAATGMQWEQLSVRERGYCVCIPRGFLIAPAPGRGIWAFQESSTISREAIPVMLSQCTLSNSPIPCTLQLATAGITTNKTQEISPCLWHLNPWTRTSGEHSDIRSCGTSTLLMSLSLLTVKQSL